MNPPTRRSKPRKPFPSTDCEECAYLREERAAIHEFDGKMSRVDAERAAVQEQCNQCRNTQTSLL